MKKNFAKILLFGAMIIAGFAFVGCKDLETDIQNLNDRIAALEGEVEVSEESLKTTLAALQGSIDKMKADYALKAEVEALETELTGKLTDALKPLSSAVTALETALASKADKSTVEALQKALADAQKVAADNLAKLQAVVDGKADKAALDAVSGKVSALESGYATLKSQYEALINVVEGKASQADLDTLANDVALVATDVADLKKALKDANDAITALNNQVIKNQTDILALKGEYTKLQTATTALDASIKAFEVRIAALEEAKADHEARIKNLEAEVKALEADFMAADSLIRVDINAYKAFADANKAAIDSLKAANVVTLQSIQNLDFKYAAEIAKVNGGIVNLNADIERIDSVLRALDDNAGEMESEFETVLEAALEEAKAELEVKIDSNLVKITDLETAFEEYKVEVELLMEEVYESIEEMMVEVEELVAEEVEKICEIIAKVAEMVSVQVQSVVFVPQYSDGLMNGQKFTVGTDKEFMLVGGTFEVSPVKALENVEIEDFSFVGVTTETRTKAAAATETFEAKVVSIDEETGRIQAYAYVPKSTKGVYADAEDAMFALKISIANKTEETEIDLGSYVQTSYEGVAFDAPANSKDLLCFYDEEEEEVLETKTLTVTHKVPFNTPVEQSAINLYNGYSYKMELCGGVFSLSEASYLLGTTFNVTYGTSDAEKPKTTWNQAYTDKEKGLIKFTGTDLSATAKLNLVSGLDFEDYIGMKGTYTIETIKLNGVTTDLKAEATYEISMAPVSANIVVETITANWNRTYAGETYHNDIDGDTVVDEGELVDLRKLDDFVGADLSVSGNNIAMTDFTSNITLQAAHPYKKDEKLTLVIKAKSKDNVEIVSCDPLPYGKTYQFIGEATADNYVYSIGFEVKVGDEPADAEIALGSFSPIQSSTVSAQFDITPLTKVLAQHASFYGTAKTTDIASTFASGVITVKKGTEPASGIEVAASAETKENVATETSKLKVDKGLASGTYDVTYVVNAYGVKYTFKATVTVKTPTYTLSTVSQFVNSNNEVIVSGVVTKPEIKINDNGVAEVVKEASFTNQTINLKDYFKVVGVSKEYAADVKVVYVVSKIAANTTYNALWNKAMYQGQEIAASQVFTVETAPATVTPEFSTYSAVAGSSEYALTTAEVDWTTDVNKVTVTAYLMPSDYAGSDYAKDCYSSKTISIVQKDRISSFSQIAGTGEVAYQSGSNTVNIMKFLEVKDFDGNILSNKAAENLSDFWYYYFKPTADSAVFYAEDVNFDNLYGQEIKFADPKSDVGVFTISDDGTLTFTENSATLNEPVVVTVPVFLGYEYDNYGATAKKVDVKVTFKPAN